MDELERERVPEVEPEREGVEEPALAFALSTPAGAPPVLRLRGELDVATVDLLDETMNGVLDTHPGHVIIDVREVSFADSSAIAKLVQWSKMAHSMELRGASPLLRRVLSAMGLDSVLELT